MVLCNFDEFWIYDFNTQLPEPLDRVPVKELPARHAALNFLYPRKLTPIFGNNWVEVTREAARRFVLQCVVAMFAEDIGLLPQNAFTGLH